MKLADIATYIRSANAGATLLTFDIGFSDAGLLPRVLNGGLSADVIARLYGVAARDVRMFEYHPAAAIKITIPRHSECGGIDERDFDGVQQYPLLLDLDIDLDGPPQRGGRHV